MNDASRFQGWAICTAAGLAALVFVTGLLNGSYWALAIPVAVLTLFALSLVAWVGFTIATIRVEADTHSEILSTDAVNTSETSETSQTAYTADASSSTPTTTEDAA